MSKLQNDFTTQEQSKRLLELGLPADSANLFYSKFECETFENRPTLCYDKKYSDVVPYGYENDYFPCWSVGRLIEIMKICNHPDDVDQVFCELAYSKKNLVELIIRLMEENKEITDFSKLEE